MATPISDISLGEVTTSSKGAKAIPLVNPLFLQPGPLRVVWKPSAFQQPDASRVNICFAPDDATSAFFQSVDLALLKLLSDDPKKYFGTVLTYEQIRERYHSAIKVSEKGYTTLKVKMNLTGPSKVRCWSPEKAPREMPMDWGMASVRPGLQVKRSILV